MPFSFSNISGTALIIMLLYLTIAEIIKHSKKQVRRNSVGK